MRNTLKYFWLIAGFFATCPEVWGQQTYSTDAGLSSNSIRDIYQDRRGFLWIATADGLNRFDGYHFTVFRHDPDDSTSLSNNNLYDLLEDREGKLWIASLRGGLNCYDPVKDLFYHYKHDPHDSTSLSSDEVISLFQDREGTIWVGTSRGLNQMVKDPAGNISFVRHINKPEDPGGQIKSVFTIGEDERGYLWVGTTSGLLRFDKKIGTFKNYHYWPGLVQRPSPGIVNDITTAPDGTLWTGQQPGGFQQITYSQPQNDSEDEVIFSPHYTLPYPENVAANRVAKLLFDKKGNLWLGTYDGLFRYANGEISRGPVSSKTIHALCEDLAGNVWFSTTEGLQMVAGHTYPFFVLPSIPQEKNSLPGPVIGSVAKDHKGNLWIGTEKGLSRIDASSGEYTHFSAPNQLFANEVNDITFDSRGRLYFSCNGSVSRIDDVNAPVLRHFTYKPNDPTTLSTLKSYGVYVDEEDQVWIPGYKGLMTLQPDNDSLELCPFDSANNFTHILSLGKDSLLIGSQLGLFAFDKVSRTFHKKYLGRGKENEVVKYILRASDGKIWLGTQTGLHLYKNGKGITRSFSEKHGMRNAFLRGIQEDRQGYLWISSNKGITKFDSETETFKNYTAADGLPSDQFVSRACFRDSEGKLYFGTDKGLVYFQPEEIRDNDYVPPVVISGFRLFNDPVLVGKIAPNVRSHTFMLEKSVFSTEEIRLKHHQRVLSFSFTALNYHLPEKNRYAYQLEGFDEEWLYTDAASRNATYTNLDPGTYTFRVKASNNDGVWNENGASLRLKISPPWWKTGRAYTVYVVLGGLIIAGFIRYRTEEVRRQMRTQALVEKAKQDERENVRARSSRDFHDEAGNKLTKISLYTGLMKQQSAQNPQMTEYLNRVEENLKELSSGMRDFIWVLDPKHDSLPATLIRIRQFGDTLFEHSGIDFHYQNQIPESVDIALDLNTRRNLLMIFKEAMNNSLKYAQAHTVRFSAFVGAENELVIRLTDDGLGFDPNNLARVNGLHNMRSRAAESGAVLDIEGTPGLGTTVTFRKNTTTS
ncbi:MAG: two-component regulator propeller domain-containing protein [Bacteroidia bacterium]|nr:two-component regulator propeller domain-containing protein [Bacteroidia bacterium]